MVPSHLSDVMGAMGFSLASASEVIMLKVKAEFAHCQFFIIFGLCESWFLTSAVRRVQ